MTNRFRIVSVGLAVIYVTSMACGRGKEAPELHIAAAANLTGAVDELSREFERQGGMRVVRTLGGTAQLAQQIENGAPIDVFLSADVQHVDELIAKGVADAQSRAIYTRGRLVVWAPMRPDIASLRDLASRSVREVGCARPELAPYGAAAVEALKKQSLWKDVEPKLVYAQSISASKQFADSGNTAASFTALSLVFKLPGHYFVVDDAWHAPLDQSLCIVKATSQQEGARRFRAFVLGAEGRSILKRYGYSGGR